MTHPQFIVSTGELNPLLYLLVIRIVETIQNSVITIYQTDFFWKLGDHHFSSYRPLAFIPLLEEKYF